jgi:protein gp37
MAHRFKGKRLSPLTDSKGQFAGVINCHAERLNVPLKRKKPTVYAIWNDLFHESVPLDFIDDVLDVISACPQHTFLALTKRAHLIEEKLYDVTPEHGIRTLGGGDYLRNLWVGVTVCTPDELWKIIVLIQTPAAHRWVNFEPMLGPMDLSRWMKPTSKCGWCGTRFEHVILSGECPKCGNAHNIYTLLGTDTKERDKKAPSWNMSFGWKIDAVILGGETGPKARPLHPGWVISVRDQCKAAGVPFFFKGWGSPRPGRKINDQKIWVIETLRVAGYDPKNSTGGRLLDGREHNELPWRLTCPSQ